MASEWDSNPYLRRMRDRSNEDYSKIIEMGCKSYNADPQNRHKERISAEDVIEYNEHGFIQVKKDSELQKSWDLARKNVAEKQLKSGNTFQYEPSAKVNRMEKSLQKTKKKARKARNKTQKTIYRMERVLDEKTGKYTFKAVAHRVDKNYGSMRKRLAASKGKELAKQGYYIMAENMSKDDGQMEYAEGAVRGVKTGYQYGKGIKSFIHSRNQKEAMRLEKKAQYQGFQLEAQKNAEKEMAAKKLSDNRIKRAMQKEAIKNKYKRQAVKQYAQQQSSVIAFLTSKESRIKILEEVKKTVGKYVLAGGAIIILLGSLLGGCTAMFQSIFGGTNMILQGAYAAPAVELEQAENYFNQFEMLLVEEITTFYDGICAAYSADANGVFFSSEGTEYHIIVNYDLEAVRHNPNVLMNYLTTRYGEFDFTENDLTTAVPQEIRNLFTSCYGVNINLLGTNDHVDWDWTDLQVLCGTPSLVDRSEQVPDVSGNMVTHEWKDYIWTVGGNGDFVPLETVVENNISGLSESFQERYELLTETNGLLQVATGIMEEDWYDDVLYNYGNAYEGVNYHYDGWYPLNGDSSSWAETFRNYTTIDCSMGRTLYAGMEGTVTAVTSNSVTIEVIGSGGSGLFAYKEVTFSGLSSVSVTANQAVTDETSIGTCTDVLYLYYNQDGTYYNPTFYVR